jgi:hypothetical protein
VEKEPDGSICLPEVSEEEMDELVKEWSPGAVLGREGGMAVRPLQLDNVEL